MTTEDTPTPPALPENVVVREQLDDITNELRREIAAGVAHRDTAPVDHLAEFPTFGHAVQRAASDHDTATALHRALADNIVTDNPGVIPEGWVKDVKGIIDRGRPLIGAFGTEQLPGSGMDVNFPYLDPNLDLATVVDAQATEKTAITSVAVKLLKGTADINTYAGGSDNSLQLIQRSDPSYLDALMRVYTAAMSVRMETAASAAFVAAATGTGLWVPATGTAAELRAALFTASADVQAATGAPASFAAVATDVWTAIGTLEGLWPQQYGTQNVTGTADAGSLRVNVSGLPVVHCPQMAAGAFLVSNSQAASTMEAGTRSIEAVNVELLGVDKAVYNLAAFVPYLPAGIVSITAV